MMKVRANEALGCWTEVSAFGSSLAFISQISSWSEIETTQIFNAIDINILALFLGALDTYLEPQQLNPNQYTQKDIC
jgi:hypothetical protein